MENELVDFARKSKSYKIIQRRFEACSVQSPVSVRTFVIRRFVVRD